jgi:hypothetical protein
MSPASAACMYATYPSRKSRSASLMSPCSLAARARVSARVCVCTRARMCVRASVCACVCVCVCVCVVLCVRAGASGPPLRVSDCHVATCCTVALCCICCTILAAPVSQRVALRCNDRLALCSTTLHFAALCCNTQVALPRLAATWRDVATRCDTRRTMLQAVQRVAPHGSGAQRRGHTARRRRLTAAVS